MKRMYLIPLLFGLIVGCGQPTPEPTNNDGGRIVQKLQVEFDQNLIFPTSILTFRMRGSDRMVPSAAQVFFEGSINGSPFTYDSVVTPTAATGFDRTSGDQGDVIIQVSVDQGLWADVAPSPLATFDGDIRVELIDEIGPLADAQLLGLLLDFQADATPNVNTVSSGSYYSNEHIPVTGQNFLRPEEGDSWAVVDGVFTYQDTELGTRAITGQRTRIRWTGSRTSGEFHIDPGVFGIRPGQFEGSLRFENELRNGQPFSGNSQAAHVITLGQPFLAALNPPAGSRGQRISFQGRGFVPQADDDSYVMFFRFDGVFTYDEGGELDLTADNALERPPDNVLSDDTAEMAVWYEIVEVPGQPTRLVGLGAEPGVFVGSITPIFQDDLGVFEGVAFEGEPAFTVTPQKQMVYIKYLPGFSTGLAKYGLQNVEYDIRQRILEVTNRDYERLNVEFVDSPPTDFLEYATIEIGGPDPTGGGKFGYDNTCNVQEQKCKDTRNLYLGDYLGGINVASADEFNTPFGGVFIESFDFFSKKLNPDNSDASTEFDRVFGPFMPTLDGIPVKGTEYVDGGERKAAIDEAIWVFGSVIGNTCTHEIGHSLGLAFFPQDLIRPGEAFHNKIPGDLFIMDPGSERPFEERGEVGGIGPARFNDRNMDYLLDILPEP